MVIFIIWLLITIYVVFLYMTPVKNTVYIIPIYIEDIGTTDAQNTHDPIVRKALWDKFDMMDTTDVEKHGEHIKYYIEKTNNPQLIELLKVINTENTILKCNGESVSEKIVFYTVWAEFLRQKLDLNILIGQMLDCYEDGEMVCINGRVARYISAFEGVVEGELGKSEVTEKILFQQALNETQKLYNESKKNIQTEISANYPQIKHRINEIIESI